MRATLRRCASLALRRTVEPMALPFSVSKSEALKHFGDWARVHDSAKGGWQAQDGVSIEAHAVPWWCFDVHDRDAWPTEQRRW